MYVRLHYVLVALIAANGHFWCSATPYLPRDTQPVLSDDSTNSQFKDTTGIRRNYLEFHDTVTLKGNSASSMPTDASRATPPKTPPMPSPATASASRATPPQTPPMPSPATATASPGGVNLSKVIDLLFVILLVITAILMVITGVCLMDLRRRYWDVSQPCYEQLKSVPI